MKRVLVIDDNQEFSAVMAMKLDPTFRVVRCANIGEALSTIMAGRRFDIILCRTHCGGHSGGGVFWRRLRAVSEEQASKLIFFSSHEATHAAAS